MEPYIEGAFASIDVNDLAGTLPQFKKLIAAIVRRFGPASATLAARVYKQHRIDAGIRTPFTVKPAPGRSLDDISAGVDYATKPLWGPEPDVESSKVLVHGVASKLVLDQGRDTTIGAVHEDKKATSWARVPEPGCCSFCALLATRGAVYKKDTARFQAHNNCRCDAMPVFGKYVVPDEVKQWQAVYADLPPRLSGKEARNAFRVALAAHRAIAPPD